MGAENPAKKADPSVDEAPCRTPRLGKVDVLAAGAWKVGSQFGITQGSCQRQGRTDKPDPNHQLGCPRAPARKPVVVKIPTPIMLDTTKAVAPKVPSRRSRPPQLSSQRMSFEISLEEGGKPKNSARLTPQRGRGLGRGAPVLATCSCIRSARRSVTMGFITAEPRLLLSWRAHDEPNERLEHACRSNAGGSRPLGQNEIVEGLLIEALA
jgi:hypothetical protein